MNVNEIVPIDSWLRGEDLIDFLADEKAAADPLMYLENISVNSTVCGIFCFIISQSAALISHSLNGRKLEIINNEDYLIGLLAVSLIIGIASGIFMSYLKQQKKRNQISNIIQEIIQKFGYHKIIKGAYLSKMPPAILNGANKAQLDSIAESAPHLRPKIEAIFRRQPQIVRIATPSEACQIFKEDEMRESFYKLFLTSKNNTSQERTSIERQAIQECDKLLKPITEKNLSNFLIFRHQHVDLREILSFAQRHNFTDLKKVCEKELLKENTHYKYVFQQ